jgi:hypothetical protein
MRERRDKVTIQSRLPMSLRLLTRGMEERRWMMKSRWMKTRWMKSRWRKNKWRKNKWRKSRWRMSRWRMKNR